MFTHPPIPKRRCPHCASFRVQSWQTFSLSPYYEGQYASQPSFTTIRYDCEKCESQIFVNHKRFNAEWFQTSYSRIIKPCNITLP